MEFHSNQYLKHVTSYVKAVLNDEIIVHVKHIECTSQWNEQYYNLNACKIWKHICNILETTNQ